MEFNPELSEWQIADENAREALTAIKQLINHLECMKKGLYLELARLSSDQTVKFIGPGVEVAVAGIVHALDYLAVCRNMIQNMDLVSTARALADLDE